MLAQTVCPHCNQTWSIPEEKLGRAAICKKCGQAFKLEAMCEPEPATVSPTAVASPPAPVNLPAPIADTTPKKPLPPLFRMFQMKFISGPCNVIPGYPVWVSPFEDDLVIIKSKMVFLTEEALRTPLTSITGTVVESAERMTLARVGAGLILAGPLGAIIGGFGFKRKDKLLRIDLNEKGLESSIILGGPVDRANTAILTARRKSAQQ